MNGTRKQPTHDELLDHNYDGIQEYDNPMPKWWLWIFYATIFYAVLYWANVIPGIGIGHGRMATYEHDMEVARAKQAALAAAQPAATSLTDEQLFALMDDPAKVAAGKATFLSNCSPCHRPDGGGVIGPNLTDSFWIRGSRPTQILATVHGGVLEKGMPAWGLTLSPEQITNVVSYVLTLHDTHPPTPKAPQGEKAEYEGRRVKIEAAESGGAGAEHPDGTSRDTK